MSIKVYFSHSGRENIIKSALGVSQDALRIMPSGKPYLENGPEFSLSDCDGIYVCAVSDAPVGIDMEKIKPRNTDMVSTRFHEDERSRLQALTAQERTVEFYRMWTLKEAYSKLIGTGISKQALGEINTLNLDVRHKTVLYCGEYVISICCSEVSDVRFSEQVEQI